MLCIPAAIQLAFNVIRYAIKPRTVLCTRGSTCMRAATRVTTVVNVTGKSASENSSEIQVRGNHFSSRISQMTSHDPRFEPARDTSSDDLEWLNFLPQNCNIFSQFQVYLSKASNKFVKLLLNNFYPVMSRRRVRKESDELLCTVLVTRYGPQSVASASD